MVKSRSGVDILYLSDTLCGWCNIARLQVNELVSALPALSEEVGTAIRFEMLHVRLFVGDYVPEISESTVARARRVGFETGPKLTGQRFSEAYIELLQRPGYRHDSHLSSLGFAAVSRLSNPDAAYHFAETLQSRVYDHGEAASDRVVVLQAAKLWMEAYAAPFSLADFDAALEAPETMELALKTAERAAAWMEKAEISGAPAMILSASDSHEPIHLDPYRAKKNLATLRQSLAA